MRCRSRSVVAAGHGDGKLGGCRRCIFLEDGLDLHIGARHGELIVLDGHAAADDLPLLEVVAGVWRCGQANLRTDHGFCMRCRSRSVVAAGHGDGELLLDLILHRQRAVDPVERIPLVPAGFEGSSGDDGVGSGGIACRGRRDFLVACVKQLVAQSIVQHRIPVVRASLAVQQAGAGHKVCGKRIALGDGCAACRHGESARKDPSTGDNIRTGPW